MGDFNGISTAYDTGTGTLKEYRGKGLATKIFEYSIPYLKKVNIKQYLLEVLQHNTNAISVYKNLDFKVTREFNYFFQKNKEIKDNVKKQEMRCFIKRMDTLDFNGIREFWDFHPSWQNSFEAVKRDIEAFVFFGAYIDKKLVGYCVFEPASGDITQIAVDKHYRKQGIGTGLFFEATRLNKNDTVKIVNTDISCHSITNFLETTQIPLTGKQFEMIKRL
jgi:ribosomal protein S18 acetylase RimI-like enzyme